MKQTAEKISARISSAVRLGEPMSRHTSFKIGGPADLFIEPGTKQELIFVLDYLRQENIPSFILGNGTNLLVYDEGYRGAVIRLSGEFDRITYHQERVDAGAAVGLAKLAKDACKRGLGGLEFAAGIPGTLGGAVVMNAGAHSRAVSDTLVSAEILTADLKLHTLMAEELGFSYRRSNIPETAVVCSARFRLDYADPGELARTCVKYQDFRQNRQPRQPNAGSIFKNPPGDAAGRLIEAAGLKGRSIGGAMISDVHANFIVNRGNATACDVLSLIETVKAEVFRHSGYTLELEIRLLGN